MHMRCRGCCLEWLRESAALPSASGTRVLSSVSGTGTLGLESESITAPAAPPHAPTTSSALSLSGWRSIVCFGVSGRSGLPSNAAETLDALLGSRGELCDCVCELPLPAAVARVALGNGARRHAHVWQRVEAFGPLVLSHLRQPQAVLLCHEQCVKQRLRLVTNARVRRVDERLLHKAPQLVLQAVREWHPPKELYEHTTHSS